MTLSSGWWDRSPTLKPRPIADALAALGLIAPPLAERLVERMLAAPKEYGLDAVVLPTVLDLMGRHLLDQLEAVGLVAPVARLWSAVLTHLRARVAEPLEPPQDWRRDDSLPCRCQQCRELAAFLADPVRERWTLKAAEPIRAHMEDTIRRAGADLDVTTERQGRPYTLLATKNQASYSRRVSQRRAPHRPNGSVEASWKRQEESSRIQNPSMQRPMTILAADLERRIVLQISSAFSVLNTVSTMALS